jgi:predicted adenylyl cyclase CyaB
LVEPNSVFVVIPPHPTRRDIIASNVEIKSRCRDCARQTSLAEELADDIPQQLQQEDTFFCVPTGRLKLREFTDGSGELIQYERADAGEPTESQYVLAPTDDPLAMKAALTNALGVRAVVRKQRTVYLVGQTRVHFDCVENLGEFIELEVVLAPGQSFAEGAEIAADLMKQLEIDERDLVESAYVDLLE